MENQGKLGKNWEKISKIYGKLGKLMEIKGNRGTFGKGERN